MFGKYNDTNFMDDILKIGSLTNLKLVQDHCLYCLRKVFSEYFS